MKKYKKVLSIAGSDSCGGAGVQADLKTFSSLSCYGATVITALTAQNTTGVKDVWEVPVEFVEKQIETVLDDIEIDAVKTGMLWSGELIERVAVLLKKYQVKNVVVDPVMVAQSGDSLVKGDVIDAYKKYLAPLTTVFTPNLPEASSFLGYELVKLRDMEKAAKEFALFGCENVLIKGGHLVGDDCVDVLYSTSKQERTFFKERRINTNNNHGTGCTLSSAIAAYLAKGYSVERAIGYSKQYITKALNAGAVYELGKGAGVPLHFHATWR